MRFSWSPEKSKSNFKKHKVTFEEAVSVFYDPFAKVGHDPDHSDEEDRFILIGHSHDRDLLFVVHVYRDGDETVRLISARRATAREKKDFENL